jgi:hypothetical protein
VAFSLPWKSIETSPPGRHLDLIDVSSGGESVVGREDMGTSSVFGLSALAFTLGKKGVKWSVEDALSHDTQVAYPLSQNR